ncbi:D-alanyl-D-alanine carboxypeptidase [Alteribacillus persepolensis]|uniref:D-alanyl-D-alanine carboxypeptidase n=1 Tax=Alteribacillus persepolensis TaxID=568899 RepID=A0A1G7ZM42_9BACI|nr:D-alanyl-D-alanine carboxypeptidase family protein [Alteribacillus persepolensis]SDH09695.1 D-alanyl-D-alanine carboxypeptidase [Alteribacillus persepolensis]
MKKLIILIVLSIIIIAGTPPSVNADHHLSVSGRTAVLLEQDSGRVLFGKEEHEPRKIASITKIMTAILAVESRQFEETVKVSSNAAGVEGSSLYLKPGENITLKDLTYGLMMRSGNDAAVAIAEHVGGSVDGFVYLMNEKAEQIGMENTQFTNPHGLDDGDSHYSTAYDMALLMQYAMKNEQFQEISQTKKYRAPQEGERWDRIWTNKNKLLTSMYKHCTGGKTGYTKAAGRTLVTTAEKDGMSLVAVTLDAPSDWNDHITMYEWGFSSFHQEQLADKREEVTVESVEDGTFYLPYTLYYPLQEEEKQQIRKKVILNDRFFHGTANVTAAGKIEWYIGDEHIYSMPLMYEREQAAKEGFFHKMGEFIRTLTGGSV